MTETIQTSATIVRDQLADVLVTVPDEVIERLSVRDQFRLLDWVELAKTNAANQTHVPVVEVAAVRECLTDRQTAGDWSAFTTWRPAPVQRGLF